MQGAGKLVVSSSPHLRARENVSTLMFDVVLALSPAAVVGVLLFGPRALAVILVSVAAAVGTESLLQAVLRKPITVGDFSAVITGILLAFNLPPGVPLWLPVVGAAFAIALVKQAFGGLGHNFVNPALAARATLLAAWPAHMTTWVSPFDATTAATPLAIARGTAAGTVPAYLDMFLGRTAGCLGETSALALLLGGVYLVWRKVIDWRIPAGFIATVALLSWVAGPKGLFSGDPLRHILSGGLFLGAFFMATDYVTSPVTWTGRLVMGIGCGVITVLIRMFGGYPEGVSYSILIMNVATPLIDRYTKPRRFGGVRR